MTGRGSRSLTAVAVIAVAVAVVVVRLVGTGPAATPSPSAPAIGPPSAALSPSPPPSLPPSSSPSAFPSPSPSEVVGTSGGLLWRSVSMAQFGGVELTNIATLRDGFLAIGAPWGGSPPLFQSPGRPSLWRSSDGLSWRRLPDSPAFTEPKSGWFDSIASGAQGGSSLLVAVGAANNGDLSAFDAAAWTSTDGISWRRATVDRAADAAMNDVTTTPEGFVAVGINGHPSGGTQMIGSQGAAAWTSRDGSHWSRVPTVPAFAGAEMTRVVAVGSTLIAVGVDIPTGSGTADPPIWSSTDGLQWARASVDVPRAVGSWWVNGIAWTGSRFVAIGGEELGVRRFVWISREGRSWDRLNLALPPPNPSGLYVRDVASLGSTMVMVGAPATPAAGNVAIVWESTDGLAWQAIPSLPLFVGAMPGRVISGPAGLLVLSSNDESNATSLWLATTPAASSPKACRATDVAMTSGSWGGAAGTTYVSIVLTLRSAMPCLLPSDPAIAIRDRAGRLVISASGQGVGTVELRTSATASVGWSSWCSAQPLHPLTLRLTLRGGGSLSAALPAVFGASCMGTASSLFVNGLSTP